MKLCIFQSGTDIFDFVQNYIEGKPRDNCPSKITFFERGWLLFEHR